MAAAPNANAMLVNALTSLAPNRPSNLSWNSGTSIIARERFVPNGLVRELASGSQPSQTSNTIYLTAEQFYRELGAAGILPTRVLQAGVLLSI